MEFGVVADLKRWANPESLSEAWVDRTRLIAEWFPAGAHVADIGCGRMALEGFLRGGSYHPVDIVARDNRTLVIDLTRQSLPDDFLLKVDYVALLGVLEYLPDPKPLLRQLSAAGISVICTYQLADFTAADVRQKNGWFTSFRAIDIPLVLRECGFEIAKSRLFDAQGLYLALPAHPKYQSAPQPPVVRNRKSIVLSGFFGRGNTGDEALLQVEYEKLSPHFDIIISVDRYGAYNGFQNWYPYDKCQIIHRSQTEIFSSDDVTGLHIGGGGLTFGVNGTQLLAALAAGKNVCSTGIDADGTYRSVALRHPRLLRSLLAEFAVLSARSAAGHQFFQEWAPHAVRGTDWAFGLESDSSPDVKHGQTIIVLREFPVELITPTYRRCVAKLLETLAKNGHDCVLLPFCPEDERMIEYLEGAWGTPCERQWWNPRRMKQLIQQAKLVISVGRLHPLIFSASVGTPCIFANLATDTGTWKRGQVTKARVFCEENGIQHFNTFSELCAGLDRGEQMPEGVTFGTEHQKYFDNMVHRVLQKFSEYAVKRKTA